MQEIKGELWDFFGKPNKIICITTNGFVKKNGEAVMGRGCAAEAKLRIPQIAAMLGYHLTKHGNLPYRVPAAPILTFPVKHNWWEEADLKLIRDSAKFLASCDHSLTYILPRPGCGNGRLTWEQVKPVIEFLPDNVWVISR